MTHDVTAGRWSMSQAIPSAMTAVYNMSMPHGPKLKLRNTTSTKAHAATMTSNRCTHDPSCEDTAETITSIAVNAMAGTNSTTSPNITTMAPS